MQYTCDRHVGIAPGGGKALLYCLAMLDTVTGSAKNNNVWINELACRDFIQKAFGALLSIAAMNDREDCALRYQMCGKLMNVDTPVGMGFEAQNDVYCNMC